MNEYVEMNDKEFKDMLIKGLDISKSKAADLNKVVRHPSSKLREFIIKTSISRKIDPIKVKNPGEDLVKEKDDIFNTKKYLNKLTHKDKSKKL